MVWAMESLYGTNAKSSEVHWICGICCEVVALLDYPYIVKAKMYPFWVEMDSLIM